MKTHNIRARLTIYGMGEMKRREFVGFRNWIHALYHEMKTANPKDYLKIFRATLYKPPITKKPIKK